MNKEEIAKMQEKYKLTEEEYEEYYKTVNGFFTTGKKTRRLRKHLRCWIASLSRKTTASVMA